MNSYHCNSCAGYIGSCGLHTACAPCNCRVGHAAQVRAAARALLDALPECDCPNEPIDAGCSTDCIHFTAGDAIETLEALL